MAPEPLIDGAFSNGAASVANLRYEQVDGRRELTRMAVGIGAGTRDAVRFGPFSLSIDERQLTRDGTPVELGARALDILIALVSRPHAVLEKRELMAAAWPDVTVEEGSLRFHVVALRKALGDGRDGARYIATLPGRGYCFVAPLAATDEPGGLPAVSVLSKSTNALPARPARMIGRADGMAALSARLSTSRFVTIVGPGGVGKTTLALAIAHDLLEAFAGSVLFVDLGLLSDPGMVATSLASLLGIPGRSDDPMPGVINHLRDRRILLVLDNCEHVVEAAAAVTAAIFRATSQVHLLTTSREALRSEGEHVYKLEPLTVPPEGARPTADVILAFSAPQLFVERAAACGVHLDLNEAYAAGLVAEICRRLDGMALAIELAASRVEALGLRQTAALLDKRLSLLWQGRRSAPARQQTLQATLDWSYALLTAPERTILRRLAAFAGPFTIEAALAVASCESVDQAQVLACVESLVAQSMVAARQHADAIRYRLLATTRTYVLERQVDDAERAALSRRHAAYCRHWLEQTGTARGTLPGTSERAPDLAGLGDVRAALEWCFGAEGDSEAGVALAAAAMPVFVDLSLLGECMLWSERGLAALSEPNRGTMRELTLQAALAVSSMFARGNSDTVRTAIVRGIGLAEALGDKRCELDLLAGLHTFLNRAGDFRSALACAERCSRIARELGDEPGIAMTEWMLGLAHHLAGNQDAAQRHCERGFELEAASGRVRIDAFGYDNRNRALIALARAVWLRGFPEKGLDLAKQAVDEAAEHGQPVGICMALIYTAPIFLWSGAFEEAGHCIERALAESARYSLAPFHGIALALKGELLILRGEPASGIPLLRGSLKTMEASQYNILPTVFSRALAEGLLRCGQLDEAQTMIDRALAMCERGGEIYVKPDLLRVRAEIRLALTPPDEKAAEDILLQALELARQQSALGWELRAALPLARLWKQQGHIDRARALLDWILGRFADGSATADLRAARVLQAALRDTSAAAPLVETATATDEQPSP